MKIEVKDGVIWHVQGIIKNMIEAPQADRIARANHTTFAEHFVKKYEGYTLELDDMLKIKVGTKNGVKVEMVELKIDSNPENIIDQLVDQLFKGIIDSEKKKHDKSGEKRPYIHDGKFCEAHAMKYVDDSIGAVIKEVISTGAGFKDENGPALAAAVIGTALSSIGLQFERINNTNQLTSNIFGGDIVKNERVRDLHKVMGEVLEMLNKEHARALRIIGSGNAEDNTKKDSATA